MKGGNLLGSQQAGPNSLQPLAKVAQWDAVSTVVFLFFVFSFFKPGPGFLFSAQGDIAASLWACCTVVLCTFTDEAALSKT